MNKYINITSVELRKEILSEYNVKCVKIFKNLETFFDSNFILFNQHSDYSEWTKYHKLLQDFKKIIIDKNSNSASKILKALDIYKILFIQKTVVINCNVINLNDNNFDDITA